MAQIHYNFSTQKEFNKYSTRELEETFDKFSKRQYFIGITEDEVCVRCLYLRLWTGKFVKMGSDGPYVKECTNNVFILEREFAGKRIVGVK